MKNRMAIYCHYYFSKTEGCKIGFLLRYEKEDRIIVKPVETVGIEQLEMLAIKEALLELRGKFNVEIFMLPCKLSKKVIKGKATKEFTKMLLTNSSHIYWLRNNESNIFIDKIINSFKK